MITKKVNVDDRGRVELEFDGLSTDDKAEAVGMGARNADVFYEMDTKKVFMYDEENRVWLPQ